MPHLSEPLSFKKSSKDNEGNCEERGGEDLVGKNLLPDDCCSLARQLLVKCFVPIVMWRTLAQTDRKHPHRPEEILIHARPLKSNLEKTLTLI